MSEIDEDVQKLKQLNLRLAKALEDPHPGIAMWMVQVGTLIGEMYRIVAPEERQTTELEKLCSLDLGEFAKRIAILRQRSIFVAELHGATAENQTVGGMTAFGVGDRSISADAQRLLLLYTLNRAVENLLSRW